MRRGSLLLTLAGMSELGASLCLDDVQARRLREARAGCWRASEAAVARAGVT